MKKIGIIGSGAVGQALAKGFIKYGHNVMIGTNNDDKKTELNKINVANVGSFADTAQYGEIIVLAVKGTAALSAIEKAGLQNLNGKTVIDTTNPIADAPPENGVLRYTTSLDNSLMEQLQKTIPGANFVKAFSCIGSPFMVDPPFNEKPTMFICGNNENAKNEVKQILDKFGFETEDMGSVEAARAIEPLAILWCIPGFRQNKWNHAFRLLR